MSAWCICLYVLLLRMCLDPPGGQVSGQWLLTHGQVHKNVHILGTNVYTTAHSLLACVAACTREEHCSGASFSPENHFCDLLIADIRNVWIYETTRRWESVPLSDRVSKIGISITNTADNSSSKTFQFHTPNVSGCPSEFLTIGGRCYYVQTERVNVNYDEASDLCARKHGAQLASLETDEEFRQMREFIMALYDWIFENCINGWLLSGRLQDGEEWFNWPNGDPVNQSSAIWGADEPDSMPRNCMALFPGWNPVYTRIYCDRSYPHQFVCEL